MAFFRFRTAGEGKSAARQPESIDAMRRRARHRLIGATVLVLAGVVGFPLLFDTQPRPIPVDIPIEIPDRNKARPLPAPVPSRSAPAAGGKVLPAPGAVAGGAVAPVPVPPPAAAPKAEAAPPAAAPKAEAAPPAAERAPDANAASARPAAKAEAKAEAAKPDGQSDAKPEAKSHAKPEGDGAKAKALLEGKSKEAAAEGRFVVQVGAFADVAKAREARARLERAGLKTYTQVAETGAGKRIRVRVGPFGTKGEAEKAAGKIKGLDLPAAILTL